jgi:uncharacterized protein
MSSQALPGLVDPIRYAEEGRQLEGSIELARMPRLAGMLLDSAGAVTVTLAFGLDEDGTPCLRGGYQANVSVLCQRCLQAMRLALAGEFALAMVADEQAAASLAERYDPLLVGDEPISLAEIIEDELILELPMVPRHELSACPAAGAPWFAGNPGESAGAVAKNPFAALAALKQPK